MSDEKSTERAFVARRIAPFTERMDRLVQMCGSAAELARRAGLSEGAVRKWKSGESQPTVDRLLRLARATGVDAGWLVTGEGAVGADQVEEGKGGYSVGIPPEVVESVARAVYELVEEKSLRVTPEKFGRVVALAASMKSKDEDLELHDLVREIVYIAT